MKKSFLFSLLLLLAIQSSNSLFAQNETYTPSAENLKARAEFQDAKFGIFLHWGIYSIFAQGEWYMQDAGIDRYEYAKAANAFYPHDFDAHKWVKAFKDAGAKYICFTTRHHDGFSMWNTQQSDYNIMHTPYGKDIVKQLADECHKQGIGLHFYYSHIDWTRDDYPMGFTGKNTGKDPNKANWTSYYNFMNAQLKELLTQYGKVDGIWFDGYWDHGADKKPFNCQLPEQYALIHSLQPGCIIGNNHHITPYPGEDMQMFERDLPGENKAGLSGQSVSQLPLETCETMNGMWGYKVKDQNYKSSKVLLRMLIRAASKGANLLMNIGPQPDGNLPEAALTRLKEMGEWLNSSAAETIYGTKAGGVNVGEGVVSTRKGDTLYLHVLNDAAQKNIAVTIPAQMKVVNAKSFFTGKNISFSYDKKKKKTVFVLPDMEDGMVDYIIKLKVKG